MTHKTLFCTVGRATPRPVATVDDDAADQEARLNAARTAELAALTAGGNDPARVTFSVESGGEEPKPRKAGR